MTPRLLVCGATGTIGTALVSLLADRGVPVRALVRDASHAWPLAHPLVELVEGDFRRPASIDAALDGVHRAFLLSPPALDQVVLQGNVVEAVQRTGRSIHLVKVSAHGVAPEASFQFARWHAVTEAQIVDAGLPVTVLRPHPFMQNLVGAAPLVREEGILYGVFGDVPLPIVDARDVAAVAAAGLTSDGHEGKTYVLTGPEPLTYTAVAETMSRVLGRSVTYVDLPLERYRGTLLSSGVPGWLAEGLTELAAFIRSGPSPTVTPTVAQLTGRPARSLDRFVRDYADTFRPPARATA
jgi:uncharacterized protein YbjT (DUF2867 family)